MSALDPNIPVANAWRLLLQRGAHITSAALFAVLVPRLMGPENYGRYALVLSLAILFCQILSLGLSTIMTRYVPEMADDRPRLRAFFGRLLTVRLGSAGLSAALFLVLTLLWLRDYDTAVLLLMAAVLAVRALAFLLFSLFVGLNRAARWGLGNVIRSWSVLPLLVGGYLLDGLRGACLGVLAGDALVLLLGVLWVRPHVSWPRPRLDLKPLGPYLRFGFAFYASEVLYMVYQRSGEPMLRALGGDYAQIGYFGLTMTILYVIALSVPELVSAFVPLLTSLHAEGHDEELRRWAERLPKVIAVGAVICFFGVLFLADDLVPLVLGTDYAPVAANLVPAYAVLLVMPATNIARVLAMVFERPGFALQSALVRLLVFWIAAAALVVWGSSFGLCIAVLLSAAVNMVVFSWRVQSVFRYSLWGWGKVLLLAALFVPLAWLRGGLLMNLGLCFGACAGFTALVLLLGVVSREEVGMMWRGVRGKPPGSLGVAS